MRGELDEFEQSNIEDAIGWSLASRVSVDNYFTQEYVKECHKRMFGQVWRWAGQFRTTDKNLGVDKYQIPIELKKLFDDSRFWIKNETFEKDEIAIRFKHRLVSIHCFPNGNGRHSRLMADVLISQLLDRPSFTWGGSDLLRDGESRAQYLSALREADNGNVQPLLKFCRQGQVLN